MVVYGKPLGPVVRLKFGCEGSCVRPPLHDINKWSRRKGTEYQHCGLIDSLFPYFPAIADHRNLVLTPRTLSLHVVLLGKLPRQVPCHLLKQVLPTVFHRPCVLRGSGKHWLRPSNIREVREVPH
jgi:hypothetical protein